MSFFFFFLLSLPQFHLHSSFTSSPSCPSRRRRRAPVPLHPLSPAGCSRVAAVHRSSSTPMRRTLPRTSTVAADGRSPMTAHPCSAVPHDPMFELPSAELPESRPLVLREPEGERGNATTDHVRSQPVKKNQREMGHLLILEGERELLKGVSDWKRKRRLDLLSYIGEGRDLSLACLVETTERTAVLFVCV